jgi:hypothetical protein
MPVALIHFVRRPATAVAALLLVVGAVLSWHSGRSAGAGGPCAWVSGTDDAAVERFLRDWSARQGGPTLAGFDLQATPERLDLQLKTPAGPYRVALVLRGGCGRPPAAELLATATPGGFPTAPALRDLAERLPAARGVPGGGPTPTRVATVAWFTLITWLCLVAAALALAAREPRRAWWTAGLAAGGALLVAVAAWPLLDFPFDTDAHVMRAAFAAGNVFGDWNHPFLSYLLNRPATWISLEPRVLRAIPLAFLCLETALTVVVAARAGGPLAGALAGIWFACEAPRRHGVSDLGDWDVAGTFLLATLLWTQRRKEPGALAWVALAALLAAGVFSSYLMIVPAAVLTACLAVEALRGRVSRRAAALIGVLFLVLAWSAVKVFVAGATGPEPGHSQAVGREMLVESPLGRDTVMALPLVLGLVWAALGFGKLAERFTTLTLVAVPAAVAVAFRWSHVNGGYYVGLVTPLLCAAAAVAVADILGAMEDRIQAAGSALRRWGAQAVLRGLVIVGVVVTTVGLGSPNASAGWEYGKTFTKLIALDRLPILTNSTSLPRLLAFERARAGAGPIAEAVDPPPELARRVTLVERGTCAPPPGWDGTQSGFYLVHFRNDGGTPLRTCLDRFAPRCHELQPPPVEGDRTAWVYRCDPPGTP